MMSGKFNMEGMLKQFLQMKKMGGMSGLMSYMPGVGKIKSMMEMQISMRKLLIIKLQLYDQ